MNKFTDYQPRPNKQIITDSDEILDAVKDRIANQNPAIVTIDGFDGVGKTTLAKKLGEALNCEVISFDAFLIQKQGCFLDALRISELHTAFETAIASNGLIVAEGVCLLEVLSRIDLKPAVKIYVKKLIVGDIWFEGRVYDGADSAEEKIISEDADFREFAYLTGDPIGEDEPAMSGLDMELIRYHYKYKPDENSDFVFGRRDQ